MSKIPVELEAVPIDDVKVSDPSTLIGSKWHGVRSQAGQGLRPPRAQASPRRARIRDRPRRKGVAVAIELIRRRKNDGMKQATGLSWLRPRAKKKMHATALPIAISFALNPRG
jgi:hypothetical protein